jgi:hypothetical protein
MKVEWDWQNLTQALTALVRRFVGRRQPHSAHNLLPCCSTGYNSKILISFPQAYSTISVMFAAARSKRNAPFAKTITAPMANFRYDNCLTRTANNDAVKCICIMSCLWVVGWCGLRLRMRFQFQLWLG